MSLSDIVSKFLIETFTNLKFEDLTPFQETAIEGIVFIMIIQVIILVTKN